MSHFNDYKYFLFVGKIRNIDFQQSILLEEKLNCQLAILLENQNSNASADQLSAGVDTFLSHFTPYKDLINNESDSIEIWKRVLNSIREISQLSQSLYEAATGIPNLSLIDRQSDLFVSPTLPKRAETFGNFLLNTLIYLNSYKTELLIIAGFDERKRNVVLSTLSPGYFTNRDHSEKNREFSSSENDNSFAKSNTKADLLTDSNLAAIEVSHHLNFLLCIISQQMTTIQSLQHQLSIYRDNPKSVYRHNDQLEELRNFQDRFQEEKSEWQKQMEQKEKDIEEQKNQLKIMQEQTRKDQQDIQEQREQLYRKMEILSNQGLLISPNTTIPVNSAQCIEHNEFSEYQTDGNSSNITDRRKERWKTMTGKDCNYEFFYLINV